MTELAPTLENGTVRQRFQGLRFTRPGATEALTPGVYLSNEGYAGYNFCSDQGGGGSSALDQGESVVRITKVDGDLVEGSFDWGGEEHLFKAPLITNRKP